MLLLKELGVTDFSGTNEQLLARINRAYRIKTRHLHPDKYINKGNTEKNNETLDQLQKLHEFVTKKFEYYRINYSEVDKLYALRKEKFITEEVNKITKVTQDLKAKVEHEIQQQCFPYNHLTIEIIQKEIQFLDNLPSIAATKFDTKIYNEVKKEALIQVIEDINLLLNSVMAFVIENIPFDDDNSLVAISQTLDSIVNKTFIKIFPHELIPNPSSKHADLRFNQLQQAYFSCLKLHGNKILDLKHKAFIEVFNANYTYTYESLNSIEEQIKACQQTQEEYPSNSAEHFFLRETQHQLHSKYCSINQQLDYMIQYVTSNFSPDQKPLLTETIQTLKNTEASIAYPPCLIVDEKVAGAAAMNRPLKGSYISCLEKRLNIIENSTVAVNPPEEIKQNPVVQEVSSVNKDWLLLKELGVIDFPMENEHLLVNIKNAFKEKVSLLTQEESRNAAIDSLDKLQLIYTLITTNLDNYILYAEWYDEQYETNGIDFIIQMLELPNLSEEMQKKHAFEAIKDTHYAISYLALNDIERDIQLCATLLSTCTGAAHAFNAYKFTALRALKEHTNTQLTSIMNFVVQHFPCSDESLLLIEEVLHNLNENTPCKIFPYNITIDVNNSKLFDPQTARQSAYRSCLLAHQEKMHDAKYKAFNETIAINYLNNREFLEKIVKEIVYCKQQIHGCDLTNYERFYFEKKQSYLLLRFKTISAKIKPALVLNTENLQLTEAVQELLPRINEFIDTQNFYQTDEGQFLSFSKVWEKLDKLSITPQLAQTNYFVIGLEQQLNNIRNQLKNFEETIAEYTLSLERNPLTLESLQPNYGLIKNFSLIDINFLQYCIKSTFDTASKKNACSASNRLTINEISSGFKNSFWLEKNNHSNLEEEKCGTPNQFK